jgi:predicted enzyme related to lactoylglutathione lyase
MVYFTVDNTDEVADKADKHGGNLVTPPKTTPSGRIAVVEDAQAARFAIFQGEVDD